MDPFIGEIRMFGGNFAPRGWAFCNGQLLAISSNTALFSLLGVTYGGNGQTTFALPNLQGRAPIHFGQGPGLTPRVLGEMVGTENVTLLSNQMPMHNHDINGSSAVVDTSSPTNAFLGIKGEPRSPENSYTTQATNLAPMNPQSISAAGGSQPHENMQPSLAVNFIIALEGIFPSRN